VFSDINRDTADVLLHNNCTVVTPAVQPCCGSLHAHNGELELAKKLARQQINLFKPETLDAIPNLTRVELKESDWCCGSAGIYNIPRPETSAKLLDRKLEHIEATGSTTIATSNPGCHLQLQNGLKKAGKTAIVRHPISLLAEAYRLKPKAHK